MIYLDDVLGHTFDEHLNHLREVFSRLASAGLRLKPAKCRLLCKEVLYLGYIVSTLGISADPEKVRAVADFPKPTELRSLLSFLGLTSYHCRFIHRYSAWLRHSTTSPERMFHSNELMSGTLHLVD